MTTTREPRAAAVGILLFDGCDVIDVAGPYEVLLTANRLVAREGGDAAFDVRTFSVSGGAVTGYGGMGLTPSHGDLGSNTHTLDVLIVPGLIDLDCIDTMRELLQQIAAASSTVDIVAAVCTGTFLLQAAGVLDGAPATTHWEDATALADLDGVGEVRDDVRWVDAGRVVTSGGMTSGIAMTLHLVARLVDHAHALATAAQMDYVWTQQRAAPTQLSRPGG